MSQIIVLNPAETLLKSFFANVVEPSIILKGDGVLYMGPEGNKMMGFPPEHMFNMDPNQPDHPMWSWNPHTEEPTEGGMHPIDGVVAHLQQYLDKMGIRADARAIVQQAIDAFNRNHISDSHHLPQFDSPEWRKLVVGPHPTNVPGHEMATRGHDGKLFTHYGNRGGSIGLFPESGAVPFFSELNAILEDMGLHQASGELEFVKYPNISAQHLTPNVYRTKANELAAHGLVPGHILERHAPEGMAFDGAHGARHTWEVMHHLPAAMFNAPKTKYSTAVNQREAEKHLLSALQSIDPKQIPNEPITLHDGTKTTFAEAMSNPATRSTLIQDMASTPALQFMFAGAGSPATRTKTRMIMGPFLDVEGYDIHHGHADTGTRARGRSPHSYAVNVAAAAAAHGPWEADPTRSAMADSPHGLPEGADHNDIARRRQIIESMGDMMARAHDHTERWTPEWDNLPTDIPTSRSIGNLGQVMHEQVPQHFTNRFYTDMNAAPTRDVPIPGMSTGPSAQRQPPPREPPIPEIRTQPAAAAAPAARPVAPQIAPRPLTPELQAARRQIGGAEGVTGVREAAGGMGIPLPEKPANVQRFQHSFGDPHQTLIDQWQRSNDSVEMLDRIEKAMEELQLKDAQRDVAVLKHLPNRQNLNLNIEGDVALMANKLGLTKHDIRSLVVSKGDWHRVAEVFDVPAPVVGAVKVVFS